MDYLTTSVGKVGEAVGNVSHIVGIGCRRDAIGRVVVEDGLGRMHPYGSGLHAAVFN